MKKNIVIHPDFECYRPLIEELDEKFHQMGEVIYKARNEVRRVPLKDGSCLNIKRFSTPIWINRFAYTFVRKPKAERAYINAGRLQSMGIGTPSAVAYVLCYKGGLLAHSYLLTLHLEGMRNMYEFAHSDAQGREDVVEQLGVFAARLHQKGVLHKDFSPGNILFCNDPAQGGFRFYLVDINRLNFGPVSFKQGCRSFARLWGEERFFRLLAQAYARERGYPVQETVATVWHYRQKWLKR